MANEVQTSSDPTSVTALVTGIVTDAQELLKQQLALFKSEVRNDLRKTKEAALSLVIGVAVAAVGGLLLLFMLVHLIHWAVPAAGGPAIPLWVCFGCVGGLLTVIGLALFFVGKNKFDSFNPLPDQSVDAMKENVQWIMNPK